MSTISHHSAVVSAALNLSQLDPELLLIEAETAALTRRSPRTLESWRRDGVGPKWLKLGRSVCYRVRDVRDWLAAQEFGGQPHRSRVRSSSRDAQPSEGQSEDSTKCSARQTPEAGDMGAVRFAFGSDRTAHSLRPPVSAVQRLRRSMPCPTDVPDDRAREFAAVLLSRRGGAP